MKVWRVFVCCALLALAGFAACNAEQLGQVFRDPLPEDFEEQYTEDKDRTATALPDIEGWVWWWDLPDAGELHDINHHATELGEMALDWMECPNEAPMDTTQEHPNHQQILDKADELAAIVSTIDQLTYMDLVGANAWHEKCKGHAENARADLNAGLAADELAGHVNTPPSMVPQLEAMAADNYESSWMQTGLASIALDDRIEVQNTIYDWINQGYALEEEIYNLYWTY